MENKEIRKGKLYSIRIRGREEREKGIILEEGEEWILVKSLYIDFIMDGFKLINKKYILSILREEDEIFSESVLKVNNKIEVERIDVPLSTFSLFNYLYNTQQVIQITLNKENTVYIGKVYKIFKQSFYLDPLGIRGNWVDYYLLFKMKMIRIISFDNDYIKSLLIYNKKTYT